MKIPDTQEKLEYLLLTGSGWRVSANLKDGGWVPASEIGSDCALDLIRHLLESQTGTMNFDDHPIRIGKIEVDLVAKAIKLTAVSQ